MTGRLLIQLVLFLMGGLVYSQVDYKSLRENMVSEQIKTRGITDKNTLNAMLDVPRHHFVPGPLKKAAYEDGPLPIGEGQTISQPFIVAYMTQSLHLEPQHKVLEIGTGSGYQAAILAEIVDDVFTIEIVEKLGLIARAKLKELGYNNIHTKIGDGYHGWPEESPFDAIIVTAGAESIPPALVEQLKDGGRMIIPVGPTNSVRQLVLVTKKKGKVRTKELMAVRFVPFTRNTND
ncbi:MAG: protein-L-isoaspartate(D-aspartate) O-methyltransferase [Pricia sp.]|nr:protein-L-isoaspartate(D-aspartate) O-methyltransferase [Pricia sp.]